MDLNNLNPKIVSATLERLLDAQHDVRNWHHGMASAASDQLCSPPQMLTGAP